MSACIYLLIGQSAVEPDGERSDSTVTQSLFVLHDWTHHAVRPRRRIVEQPTAVSLQPSTAIQQERRDWWDSGRWESEDTGSSRETLGAFHSANYTSSLFYSSMLRSVTQKSIEVRHHQGCPKSLNVKRGGSRRRLCNIHVITFSTAEVSINCSKATIAGTCM